MGLKIHISLSVIHMVPYRCRGWQIYIYIYLFIYFLISYNCAYKDMYIYICICTLMEGLYLRLKSHDV